MRRIFLSSALLAFATAASAQAQVAPGWAAFSGCWVPVPADARLVTTSTDHRVCVVPSGNGADLVTFAGDKETERTRIEADGQRRNVSKQGCAGWEKAEFSSDGRRLYLRSEQSCAGIPRVTSGIFAIAPNGDWINAVSVSADSANSVRVSRYATAALSPAIPAEIRTQFEARELADRTARTAAQREVGVNAVIEASKFLSAPTVEAWLAELEQEFDLDEKALLRLADEGVAPSIIDVMVAVSNPRVFSVRATGAGVTMDESDSLATVRRERYRHCISPVLDPWAWYAYDPCDPYHRYSFYRSHRYRYGYHPYYGYGVYSPYYDYGPYGNPVIIVVNGSNPLTSRPHGRMTKDGYKAGTTTGSSGSSSRGDGATTSRGSSSGSSSSGSSSSGSSSSGSSSSGSSGERTATRKPPADPEPRGSTTQTQSQPQAESKPASSSSEGSSSGSGRVATRKPPAA